MKIKEEKEETSNSGIARQSQLSTSMFSLTFTSSALQRFWEVCSSEPHPPGDSSVFDFSIMSYNILSQQLLQDNSYLYQHCHPSVLPWTYRLPNLLMEIQQHDADVSG